MRLELIKSGLSNRCEIDLATGEARLFHGTTALGPASDRIARPGTYELTFANVDDRLTLWVDGALPFGDGRTYDSHPGYVATDRGRSRTGADRRPACRGRSRHLVLKRDVYYTLDPSETDYANLDAACAVRFLRPVRAALRPERFSRLAHHPPRDYPIAPGHYLMLGDNSPWSRDGRAWGRADQIDPDLPGHGWDDSGRASWEVPEALLVGKAFCVYWPHPKPVWPRLRLGADLRLPILPYIERMRWIR